MDTRGRTRTGVIIHIWPCPGSSVGRAVDAQIRTLEWHEICRGFESTHLQLFRKNFVPLLFSSLLGKAREDKVSG